MRAQLIVCLTVCVIIVSSISLLAADKPTMLNVKEGLWEVTTTHSMSGMPNMDEMLSKVPPDQRARVEEMMKQKGMSMSGNTTTSKNCVTKEKIEKGMAFANDNKQNCTRNIVSSSPTHVEVKFRCEDTDKSGRKTTSEGTVNVDAVNADTTKGSMHTVTNSGGHDMTLDLSFTSKYLGSSCGDIK